MPVELSDHDGGQTSSEGERRKEVLSRAVLDHHVIWRKICQGCQESWNQDCPSEESPLLGTGLLGLRDTLNCWLAVAMGSVVFAQSLDFQKATSGSSQSQNREAHS